MASKTLSKDQQNFMWTSIACVDFIKLPLKDILDNQIKPADLFNRINSSSTHRTYYLRREQENICFIRPPGQPDYNDFDVTLLYTLIRNLCSASLSLASLNPTKGWGKVPGSSQLRLGDDIERLRLMRNAFAHANSAGIPDDEFRVHWNELKSVIQRIQTFMNSMGSKVNYEQKLADIERTDFGFGDLQKYKLFLEATLNQLKEKGKDEPEISITGAERVEGGEKTCFKADLKHKESHWSISWQRVRGSVINQIDISKEKYSDSTRTKLVIHSVSKDDEGEYQAVLARESNGNKRKIESNAIFLHVFGDIPKATISTKSKVYLRSTAQIKSKVSSTLPLNKYEWQSSVDGTVFHSIGIDKLKYHATDCLKKPSLVIRNTTFDDIRHYRLIVWNAIGDGVSNTVYLNVTGNPPNIACSHETCFESRSVKLIAKVYLYDICHPISELFWTVNDEEIDKQGSDGKFSKVSVDFPCLTINNVTRYDAGSYKLTATNAVGSTVSDAIELNIPEVIFDKYDEKEDGTQWFTVTIKSIPEPFLVQWRKREKNSGRFQPINVNIDEFKGSSCSFPHPVLVVKQREQLENFYFQIKIKNYIGTCTKTVQDLSNLVPGSMKSENILLDETNNGSLNEIFDDKGAGIKFAILFDDLADNFPKEKFQKLRDLIQSSKKVKNIKSMNEARSARDCFRILDSEKLFTQLDVTFMQFLLRRTECKELEDKCVEYAKGQKALGFYEIQPEDGFKHVYFHVLGDLSHFNKKKRRKIKKTVAAMVGCKTKRVFLNGYGHSGSFIAIVSIEVIYIGKLVAINKQDRYRFVHLDIDYFTVDFIKVILKIPQGSQRVDYHEHVQKTKQRTTIPPLKRTYVPFRVETSNRVFHKFEDEESMETSLKRQRVDYHEHVKKIEQHTIIPPHESTFIPSEVRVDTSTGFLHKMADEESMETSLKQKHDMINPESTSLTEALKTANDPNKDVKMPREGALDSATILMKSNYGRMKVDNMKTDFLKFEPIEYAEKLISFVNQGQPRQSQNIAISNQGWINLGKASQKFFMKSPAFHFMAGSFERGKPVKKVRRAPDSQRLDKKNLSDRVTVPKQMKSFNESDKSEATIAEVEKLHAKLLKVKKEKGFATTHIKVELPFPKRFKYNAHLRSSIRLSFRIRQISCFKPNRLWLSTDKRINEIDEDGHLLRELSVNWTHAEYHTVSKAGDLLFKKDNDIHMLSSSGEICNLHIHAGGLSCIHSSRLNGDIFVGEEELIKRFSDKGFKLQTISTSNFRKRPPFWFNRFNYKRNCNITENINGDIMTIVDDQVVAFKSDGQHKFTYSVLQYDPEFNLSGLCNDTFGHILVGETDVDYPCVHLLDIDGHGLAKLPIHRPYQGLHFNALCVDEKNNLYVGCAYRIDVYTYLSDTTVTEHDAMVIDSEFPCDM